MATPPNNETSTEVTVNPEDTATPVNDNTGLEPPDDTDDASEDNVTHDESDNPPPSIDDVLNKSSWDEKKVDLSKLIPEFEKDNKSVIDKNTAFWVTTFIFFVVIIGLFIAGVCVFFTQDPPDIPGNCLQSAKFWYVVIQKIGFIVCVLLVFLPLLKLFCSTIGLINKSQENKSIRMAQALRFCYVLKYLGKIDSELMKPLLNETEIQEKKNDSAEETNFSTKEIANFLKKIDPLAQWFVNLVRK